MNTPAHPRPQVIAVDEVDECFASSPADMASLLATAADAGGAGNAQGQKPQVGVG